MTAQRQRSVNLASVILLVAFVGIVGFLAGQRVQVNSASDTKSTTPPPSVTPTTGMPIVQESATASPLPTATTDQKLIILTGSKTSHQIVEFDPATKKKTTLYTDSDQTLKIKQVSNLTGDGTTVLAVVGSPNDDFGGSLISIPLDGSGKTTTLIATFNSPWPPTISPDGKKIVYVYFSNAEADAGFHLIMSNLDGSNQKDLARESTAITQPSFVPDGTGVVYIKQGASSGATITEVSISSDKTKTLATYTDRVPYDLTVAPTGMLAFVDGTGSQASLYQVPANGGDPAKLSTPVNGQESHPVFAANGALLAFASTSGSATQIYSYDFSSQTYQLITTGLLAIGWR